MFVQPTFSPFAVSPINPLLCGGVSSTYQQWPHQPSVGYPLQGYAQNPYAVYPPMVSAYQPSPFSYGAGVPFFQAPVQQLPQIAAPWTPFIPRVADVRGVIQPNFSQPAIAPYASQHLTNPYLYGAPVAPISPYGIPTSGDYLTQPFPALAQLQGYPVQGIYAAQGCIGQVQPQPVSAIH
jgi:hypothetical protein